MTSNLPLLVRVGLLLVRLFLGVVHLSPSQTQHLADLSDLHVRVLFLYLFNALLLHLSDRRPIPYPRILILFFLVIADVHMDVAIVSDCISKTFCGTGKGFQDQPFMRTWYVIIPV